MSSDAQHTYNRRVSAGANDTPHRRILALDVGNRRIGLAVTDGLGLTAQPLETLQRHSKRADLEALSAIVRKLEVCELVVGLPLRMGGEDSTQTQRVRAFADELRSALGLAVHFVDERLTSWEARETLAGRGLDRLQSKGKVDKIAAVLILQAYLQQRNGPALLPDE